MLVYDLVLAVLLLLGIIYYTIFMASHGIHFSARANYRVYDAPNVAKARWVPTSHATLMAMDAMTNRCY